MMTFKLDLEEDFGKNYFEKVVKKTTWNDILDKKTCKTVTRKLSGRVISVKLKTYFVLGETKVSGKWKISYIFPIDKERDNIN